MQFAPAHLSFFLSSAANFDVTLNELEIVTNYISSKRYYRCYGNVIANNCRETCAIKMTISKHFVDEISRPIVQYLLSFVNDRM